MKNTANNKTTSLESKESKETKKSFLPIISLVLSTLLLTFGGEAKADDVQGDATCKLGDAASCASLSADLGFSNYLQLTLSTSGTGYDLSYTTAPANGPFPNVTLNANNTIINSLLTNEGLYGTNLYNQNMKTLFDFKNSLWNGDFIFTSDYSPNGQKIPGAFSFTVNFDGNYTDSTNPANPLNGYALKGNFIARYNDTNDMTINFTNGAKMAGNFTYHVIPGFIFGHTGINVNFDKGSSLVGDFTSTGGGFNANFDDSSMTGKIFNSTTSTWNFNFTNSSLDATNGGITSQNYSTTNLTLKDGSTVKGLLHPYSNATLNINAQNSTMNLSGIAGADGGWRSYLNVNLDNSTFKVVNYKNGHSYENNNDQFKITATNGSKIYMNLQTGWNNGGVHDNKSTINLDNSQWIGNFTKSGGATYATFSNNSKLVGNVSSTAPGHNDFTFVNSSFTGNYTIGQFVNPSFRSTFTFSGNNATDGYAWKGNFIDYQYTTNIILNNGAKWIGNAETDWSSYDGTDPTFNLTLNDKSEIQGTVNSYNNVTNVTLNTGSHIKTVNTAYKKSGGYRTNITLNTGSSIDTVSNANVGSTTLKAYTGSSVGSVTLTGGSFKGTFDNSTLTTYNGSSGTGNITLSNHSKATTITANGGTTNLNVSDSSVGTLNSSGGTLNVAFDNSTLDNYYADTHNNTDLKLNNNSTLKGILQVYTGANATFNATNSTMGKATEDGSIPIANVIYAYWGYITGTLDHSTMYGNIAWETGTANITFQNNSSLIGSLGQNDTKRQGNINGVNNITFIDSSMKGIIGVTETNKAGMHTTLNTSFSGNSSFDGSIQTTGDATLNTSFDGTKLNITNINASSAKSDSTLTFKNISGATIGNINFGGTITGDFSGSSLGDITNTATTSNLTITNTAGHTYGNINFGGTLTGDFSDSSLGSIINTNTASNLNITNTKGHSYGTIGSASSRYNGSLNADFDFTPADGTDAIAKISDIYLGSNANADISFGFGGNMSGGKLAGMQGVDKAPVKVVSSSKNSSYTFSNIATLDLTTDADIETQIANRTGILIDKSTTGMLKLEQTSVVLNTPSTDKVVSHSIFGISNASNASGVTTSDTSLSGLGAVFGNAQIVIDAQGKAQVVANNVSNPSDLSSFYTLTNGTHSHPTMEGWSDGFVDGKSSDGDIGFDGDNFKKDVGFIFTPGTFGADQQGYTGTISGGTLDSKYSFFNAGTLQVSQIIQAIGGIELSHTYLEGILGATKKSADGKTETHPPVLLSLDYSGNPTLTYGLAIVGQGQHNLTFNFAGNTNAVKFGGSILGGDKDNASKNTLTIYNLEGLSTNTINSNFQAGSNQLGILNAFNNAGFIAINNRKPLKDAQKTDLIDGFKDLSQEDTADFVKGSTIKLVGSSFNGNLVDNDYSFDLNFSTTPQDIANDKPLITIGSSVFAGNTIDFSKNTFNQSLSFSGNDVIRNANSTLDIALGTGTTTFNAQNTNDNFTLGLNNGVANITANNVSGFIALSQQMGTTLNSASTLSLSDTSLIGDWGNGGNFVFGDTSTTDDAGNTTTGHSRFYGKLGNTATSALSVTLNQNSLFDASDALVKNNYKGSLKTQAGANNTDIFDAPTLVFSSTTSNNNKLILNNPGGKLKLEGLSNTVTLSSDSSLVSNNTTIIGDIYGGALAGKNLGTNLKVDLAFDTTTSDSTYYQGGTTDTIQGLKDGSSLSFVGKGSLRSSKYDSETGIDTGSVNINFTGNNLFNLTANNTGATLNLNRVSGWAPSSSQAPNWNIRGTSLNMVSAIDGPNKNPMNWNLSFASSGDESLLKTKDGTLLTSSKDSAGNDKNINDYIANSTLVGNWSVYRNGTININLIGDKALKSSNAGMTIQKGATVNINLINMGNAFVTNNTNLNNLLTTGIPDSKNQQGTENILLMGTNIKDLTINSDADINVAFNATFDNRELGDRVDANGNAQTSLQYYSNATAMGNTNLDIAKSALSGKVTLSGTLNANMSFYGKDAFANTASISGGSNTSTFNFTDTNLNFGDEKSQALNVAGSITISDVTASGTLTSIGSGTISTANVSSASGTKTSTSNVLAFSNGLGTSGSTDVSNINGLDYSAIKQGGSFKGTLATSSAMTYTFMGQNAQGFNVAPTDGGVTKLGSTLANAQINIIDGGKLVKANLEGTTAGSKNTLNLYGNTALAQDSANNIAINSAGLTINATIDSSNLSYWGGSGDSVDFNISNPAGDTDGSKSAIYNLTFNGNYGYHDYTHQFYKGSISGLTTDSSFTFNNAGYLKDTQIQNTLAKIILNNTVMKGNISVDNISLDFRPNGNNIGVDALTGNVIKKDTTTSHIKDISFDFTGNTIANKVINPDTTSDSNYYLAGDKGSKFTFINLTDNTTGGDVPQDDASIIWRNSTTGDKTSDSVFNTLQNAGVHLRAAKAGDNAIIQGKNVAQTLDPDSTFNFYGSTIHGDVSSSYSLGFVFDSRSDGRVQIIQGTTPNDYTSTLNRSSFYGKSISSDRDLNIALYGADAFNNTDDTLTLKAGSGRAMNITALSTDGSMGSIIVDNASKTPFASGSTLNLSGVGFKGVYLTSMDTTDAKNPKGGNITADFSGGNQLLDGSVLGTKDGSLSISVDGTSEGSDQIVPNTNKSTFIIGTGKSVLNLNNAGIVSIKSSQKTFGDSATTTTTTWGADSEGTLFGAGSSINSNNTTIIGDLYGTTTNDKNNKPVGQLALNLSFDSTTSAPSYYQGGATDTIQGMKMGSNLSFVGKGSLRSSKYDSTTGTDSGSVTINFTGNNLFNLTANNTGGTLNLNRVSNWAYETNQNPINWNIRGTSLNMLSNIDGVSNNPMNWNLSFASSSDPSLLMTQDTSLLTSDKDISGNTKDINDYIADSSFAAMWSKYRSGTTINLTLIGDKALKSSDPKMVIQQGATANINLINMGSGFIGNTTNADGSSVANNVKLNNLLTTAEPDGDTGGNENILMLGTKIGDATTNADAHTNVSLGAIFDNRDLGDRTNSSGEALSNLQYYNNTIAMGDTNLDIAKSTLSGTLTLDSNITANLAFYGKDAIASTGKIVGGKAGDSVIISSGDGGFNISSVKGFKGDAYVLNTTLNSALEDKAGVSISDGSNASAGTGLNSLASGSAQNSNGSAFANTDADASVFNSLNITFNDTKTALQKGLEEYNQHKAETGSQNTGDNATPSPTSSYLSADASTFITDNIIGNIKDAMGNPLDLDLNNSHTIDKAIGYTTSALNVNFIGKGSIDPAYTRICTDGSAATCTYMPKKDASGNITGFYIHDDNANNVYNFIDFGQIDVSTFANNGEFNGNINWVGNSYQVGVIRNGLSGQNGGPMTIDLNDLPDLAVAGNVYQATSGTQNVLFDFGGDPLKSAGVYKMTGSILEGDKTGGSTYIFSNLGSINTSADTSSDFYDTLSKTINASNFQKNVGGKDLSAIQVTSGTVGIANTSVTGDITWDKIPATDSKPDAPTYDRDVTLMANFDNAHALNGSLKGDGSKKVVFDGANSFKKDMIIQGGDNKSSYDFDNVGYVGQQALDNLLNGGTAVGDSTKLSASNAGTFSFDGSSAIVGNIVDSNVGNTTDVFDQTINLGQKNAQGMQVVGKISTGAKVDAKFGVGSQVMIDNKNENSQYDFSALAGNAPVVASINMNSDGSDGIKKAKVLGFDGDVSLIGSINDSSDGVINTNPDPDATADAIINTYDFGDTDKNTRASWLLTGNSKVTNLGVYNQSVIDLRGARMVQNTSNSNSVAGAIISGASAVNNSNFAPTTLTVENADLNNATFRLGVDTTNGQADLVNIKQVAINDGVSSGSRTGNALQVFIDQGGLDVASPILVAQAKDEQGQLNSNYFVGSSYTQGLYNIAPKIVAVPDKSDNSDTTGSGTDTTDTTTSGADGATTPSGTDTSTAVVTGAVASAHLAAAGSSTSDSSTTDSSAGVTPPPADGTSPDQGKSLSWYLTGFNAAVDTSAEGTLSSTLGTFYRDFRIATNNLNLRMGELRDNGASQGAWGRIITGRGSDKSNNIDYYTTLQAGYDYKFDVLGGVNYVGVDAEASIVSSNGDAYSATGRNLGIGIYNTYIMDNGFYVDASAKYLNLGNRISIKDSAILGDTTSNLTSNAFLLGAEVGYRYSLDAMMRAMRAPVNPYTQGYYIEPQAELIYGYIGGNNYNVLMNSATINVALSGNNALISRVGAVLGKHFKYINGMLLDVRLGLSYINELNSGGNVTLTQESGVGSTLSPVDLSTLGNNKLNLSLGANFKLNDDWRFYADVSRTFLGVYNFDYNLNVGARFNFGKKVSDLEKQIQAKKAKYNEPKNNTVQKKQTEAQEKAKLIEEKKVVKLNTRGARVGCQGCLPEKGLYLQVAVLEKKDPSAVKEFSKHSYRAYQFDLTGKNGKKQKLTRYLIGPFANVQEVYENKKAADKIVQKIDKDKNAYAIMYEVK